MAWLRLAPWALALAALVAALFYRGEFIKSDAAALANARELASVVALHEQSERNLAMLLEVSIADSKSAEEIIQLQQEFAASLSEIKGKIEGIRTENEIARLYTDTLIPDVLLDVANQNFDRD